jgi:hypothetical protein
MKTPEKVRRLTAYEECCGYLSDLVENDSILIALIGKVHLALPMSLEHSLWPLIGQKISILCTDVPDKQYLFRVLAEEPNRENEVFEER